MRYTEIRQDNLPSLSVTLRDSSVTLRVRLFSKERLDER